MCKLTLFCCKKLGWSSLMQNYYWNTFFCMNNGDLVVEVVLRFWLNKVCMLCAVLVMNTHSSLIFKYKMVLPVFLQMFISPHIIIWAEGDWQKKLCVQNVCQFYVKLMLTIRFCWLGTSMHAQGCIHQLLNMKTTCHVSLKTMWYVHVANGCWKFVKHFLCSC